MPVLNFIMKLTKPTAQNRTASSRPTVNTVHRIGGGGMAMDRKALWALCALVSCVAVAGVIALAVGVLRDDPVPRATVLPAPRFHIVLIAQERGNPYWQKVQAGAEAAARERNAFIEVRGPVQTDIEEHVKLLDMAIASRVDGIITQALTEKAFAPVINKAREKGIPVITIDTDAPATKRLAYVGSDNYRAGVQAGQALIRATGGKATVGVITGSFEAENMIQRLKGFRDAVKHAPGIRVVAVESSNISRIYAAERAERMLKDHPDLTALVGTSALDGLGIAEVLEKRGLAGRVTVIAFDDLAETLAYIEKGVITATVVQAPYAMGYRSVHLLVDALEGKPVPPLTYTDTYILTRDTLALHRAAASRESEADRP